MSDLKKATLRLDKIKLSGFKSFVDPTVVPLPSNLIGIVGPNGCGKSNIIDAVRWVMGEGSAKVLRGESMADVIFNGSSDRKPLGQASIELTFDNPEGALGGEYAQFSQIVLRREVSRDGTSNYYLNNTRCRKRDIADVFLGTGLGPRSYSIIGQNTVSRLIEAKPEELRAYIEEAAGISKYKERRRETEKRISHTRENLVRLNDVREELHKQLEHLQQQASAAEKYKNLKQEEHTLERQVLGLRWRTQQQQLDKFEHALREQEVILEKHHADLQKEDTQLEQLRIQQHTANDNLQSTQEIYYQASTEVNQYEQTLQHQEERQQQLQADLQHAQAELSQLTEEINNDSTCTAALQHELETRQPELKQSQQEQQEVHSLYAETEEKMQNWQERWELYTAKSHQSQQEAQVQQTQIQHFEKYIQQSYQRVQRCQTEITHLNTDVIIHALSELKATEVAMTNEQNQLLEKKKILQEQVLTQRKNIKETAESLDQARGELQQARGRHASLDALQKIALGEHNQSTLTWLKQNDLSESARLAECITVDRGWECAVETVLGQYLQAFCAKEIDPIAITIPDLEHAELTVLQHEKENHLTITDNSLATKVQGSSAIKSMLKNVYVVDDLQEAIQQRARLDEDESIITPMGIWLSKYWLRVNHKDDAQRGVLEREKSLQVVQQEIESLENTAKNLVEQSNNEQDKLHEDETSLDHVLEALDNIGQTLSDTKTQQKIKQARFDQMQARHKELKHDISEQETHIESTEENLKKARHAWETALQSMEKHADERKKLTAERDTLENNLQAQRQRVKEVNDKVQETLLIEQRLRSELLAKQQLLQRLQQQLTSATSRCTNVEKELTACDAPIAKVKEQLEITLTERLAADEKLQAARQKAQDIEHFLREAEQKRHEIENTVNSQREIIEKLKLDKQSCHVRQSALSEQLDQMDTSIDDIIKQLPEGLSTETCETQLERIKNRIGRLGAINLTAIEEYSTQSERLTYLDKQNDDLEEALKILEEAIAKIDKETRQKFKSTFEIINDYFVSLFPKIFGGGSATLELTGQDLLDTGVAVMARPPGKKNSTIHLLSGGEKALTAIALVFAIFHLNPAPFCMLDEVDAPLDDANVGRFCALLKEMSSSVQFIYISHNKITIEIASQLIGVTMKEPGVSRLVSVDVEEAMAMAEV